MSTNLQVAARAAEVREAHSAKLALRGYYSTICRAIIGLSQLPEVVHPDIRHPPSPKRLIAQLEGEKMVIEGIIARLNNDPSSPGPQVALQEITDEFGQP